MKIAAQDLLNSLACDVRGKLTIYRSPTDATPQKLVFQGTTEYSANCHTSQGKPLMIRRWVKPADPKTPAQLQQRARMAQAIMNWKALTDADRADYRTKANKTKLTGWQLFLSTELKRLAANNAPVYWDLVVTTWDSGSTVWDSNSTLWDVQQTIWDNGNTVFTS